MGNVSRSVSGIEEELEKLGVFDRFEKRSELKLKDLEVLSKEGDLKLKELEVKLKELEVKLKELEILSKGRGLR